MPISQCPDLCETDNETKCGIETTPIDQLWPTTAVIVRLRKIEYALISEYNPLNNLSLLYSDYRPTKIAIIVLLLCMACRPARNQIDFLLGHNTRFSQ